MALTHLHRLLDELASDVAGKLALAAFAVWLLVAVASLLSLALGPAGRRAAMAALLAAQALAWLAAANTVRHAQALLIAESLHPGTVFGGAPDVSAGDKAIVLTRLFAAEETCALLSLLALPWTAYLVVRGLSSASSRALGLALLGLSAVTAGVVLWTHEHVSFHFHCDGSDSERFACIRDSLSALHERLELGHWLLAGTALVCAPYLPFLRARDTRAMTRAAQACCFASLALGIAALTLTRARAHDARALIPPPLGMQCLIPREVSSIPLLEATEVDDRSVLALAGERSSVDGTSTATPELARAAFEAHHKLERKLFPRGRVSRRLLIAANADAPIAELAPWLEAARLAGYRQLGILSRLPTRTVDTATLGAIPRSTRCGVTYFHTGDGRQLSDFHTWSELARTASRSSLSVALR